MRIIFMGSPDFAIPSLKTLYEAGEKIVAVVTQPDTKKGRGLILSSTSVKLEAKKIGLTIYQPEGLKERGFIDLLNSIKPDAIVVVAYGQILPKEILDLPRYGCINLHGSLLPKYRGAAPIQCAIINGEKRTGVTTILMDIGMDTGNVLLQEEVDIASKDTAGGLSEKLSIIGAELLLKTIRGLENGMIESRPQDHLLATYAPPLKKEDGRIDWSKGAEEIRDRVRGMNPWPGAYTFLEGKLIKIWDVDIVEVSGNPGRIIHAGEEGILVATGKNSILIKELQLEGRSRTTSTAFLRGHRIMAGSVV